MPSWAAVAFAPDPSRRAAHCHHRVRSRAAVVCSGGSFSLPLAPRSLRHPRASQAGAPAPLPLHDPRTKWAPLTSRRHRRQRHQASPHFRCCQFAVPQPARDVGILPRWPQSRTRGPLARRLFARAGGCASPPVSPTSAVDDSASVL
jgi:hypothetical protein